MDKEKLSNPVFEQLSRAIREDMLQLAVTGSTAFTSLAERGPLVLGPEPKIGMNFSGTTQF